MLIRLKSNLTFKKNRSWCKTNTNTFTDFQGKEQKYWKWKCKIKLKKKTNTSTDFEFKCENIENRNVKPSWNNKYKWCVNIYRAGKWKIGAKREKKNCGRLKSTNDTTNTHFEKENHNLKYQTIETPKTVTIWILCKTLFQHGLEI